MMDVGQAWNALTHGAIGVEETNTGRQCFISGRQVECYATNDQAPVTLNHTEFLSEFLNSEFRPIQTQDIAK